MALPLTVASAIFLLADKIVLWNVGRTFSGGIGSFVQQEERQVFQGDGLDARETGGGRPSEDVFVPQAVFQGRPHGLFLVRPFQDRGSHSGNASSLAKGPKRTTRFMQDKTQKTQIERTIGERQLFGCADLKVRSGDKLSGDFEHRLLDIDPRHIEPQADENFGKDSASCPDVEDRPDVVVVEAD